MTSRGGGGHHSHLSHNEKSLGLLATGGGLPQKRKAEMANLDFEVVPYAQYGVTHRKITFCTPGAKSCILLCKSSPCWLWAALN
jgi:hypothetical protein